LLAVFDSAYVLALAAWVGSILFFSFGTVPVIFAVLGPEAGGRFVRALFPRYYAWGAICGAIALPAFVGVPLSFPEYRGPMVGVQALLILAGTLMMLYAGNSLTPAINATRDAGPEGQPQYERLHRRAVRLNGVVLVLGVGLLIGFAIRPAPRTSGILEMTPAERAEYDARISEILTALETRQAEQSRPGAPQQARAGAGSSASGSGEPERFPIDEATIRELVEIYTHRRRPPAVAPVRP